MEGKDEFLDHASSLLCLFSTGRQCCQTGIQRGTQAEEPGSLELCAEKA